MVIATDALSAVITSTPKKLNTAAMTIAFRTPMARVETQVAIAFGASVHPLTRITPSVRNEATNRVGFCTACRRNSIKDIRKPHSNRIFWQYRCQYATYPYYYTTFYVIFVKKQRKI